jgi:hypothetical protein
MPDSLSKFDDDSTKEKSSVSGGTATADDSEPVDISDGTILGASIDQTTGDVILVGVDDVTNFRVGDTINVSSVINTATGTNAVGIVTSITDTSASGTGSPYILGVTLGVATAIAGQYIIANYFIDNCATGYGTCVSTDTGAARVNDIGFYIASGVSFSKIFNTIVSSTTMELDYTVEPAFPDSVQVDTNVSGTNTDDALETPVGPFRLSTTEALGSSFDITISVKNFGLTLDDNEKTTVNVYLTGTIPGTPVDSADVSNGTMVPTQASIARYQFIRLDGRANVFYRGSRLSVSTVDDPSNVTGRVLLTDDNDGLLVEATGNIGDGFGIDNTTSFFANEAIVKSYQYWYLDDVTDFDIGDTVTSPAVADDEDGNVQAGEATIEAVDTDSNRIYVSVELGEFYEGRSITEDDVTATSAEIRSMEKSAYVTGVLKVGTVTNFIVGGSVSTAAGDLAVVVSKDTALNHLYILHLSGSFSDSEGIDNVATFVASETTISGIVGPITSLALALASGPDTSSGVDFREGSLVSSAAGATQRGAGYAVAGTSTAARTLVVKMEHFDADKWIDIGDNLDDYTVTNTGLGSPYTVASSTLSNLMIGYVDEQIHLEPFILGSFSSAEIVPEVPDGLSFDTTTGLISGTPTEPTNLQSYTLTFNYPGESSVAYVFSMVIYNQFQISQTTANTSSFLLHKEGRGLAGAECKVYSSQVIDDPSDPLYETAVYGYNDVVCRLEGGEQDFYRQGIELNIKAGGGMCEFIRYRPFSYQGVPEGATSATYVRYSDFSAAASCNGGTATSSTANVTTAELDAGNSRPTATRAFGQTYCTAGTTCIINDGNPVTNNTEELCQLNHSLADNGNLYDLPNADYGSYTLTTVSCTEDAGQCDCSEVTDVISCDAESGDNIAGPIRDLGLNPTAALSILYPSLDPLNEKVTIDKPIDSFNNGNYSVANYASQNACYSATTYHVENSVALGATTHLSDWEAFANQNDAFGGSKVNPFYTFECLNASGDIKARIRMQAREWDRDTFTPESSEVEELIPASPMDDSTLSCFGNSCNNYGDYDDNNGTDFGTCAETQAMSLGGTTVDIEAGSHIITANSATFDPDDFRRGTLIKVGPGDELTFVVDNYISTTQIRVTVPSLQTGTGLAVDFYDGFRFPLEGF